MRNILIIDDNEQIRNNLKEILQLSGYQVITADGGKEGVLKSFEMHPDLILCDVVMPNLDGYATLEILNKNRKTAGIPVIFMAEKESCNEFRKAMSLGAFDYLSKPWDDLDLLKTVEMRFQKLELLKQASEPSAGSVDQFLAEARGTEALSHLPENCETRVFRKNDAIFREDTPANWLYYIEKGKVKVFKTSDDGRELITDIYSNGEFVGYLPLLLDAPYTESAVAMEGVQIKLIPKVDFLALVFGNHDVAVRFIKMLANHVAEKEDRLLQLAYNSVRKRLASALLNEAAENDGQIKMYRGDLASIVGAAKETLIRALFEFKSEGMIDISGQIITLRQPEKLQGLVN